MKVRWEKFCRETFPEQSSSTEISRDNCVPQTHLVSPGFHLIQPTEIIDHLGFQPKTPARLHHLHEKFLKGRRFANKS